MGQYFLTDKIKPIINYAVTTSHTSADLIFGWTAFEIPKGVVTLKHFNMFKAGLDGVDANIKHMDLYFAKAVNGVAPSGLGVPNAGTTAAIMQTQRNNIIGIKEINDSYHKDAGALVAYNIWSSSYASLQESDLILSGDPEYNSTQGYQTLWIGAFATESGDEFGTAVALDQAGNQAASTAAVQITTDGTDPRLCFAAGDILIGSTLGPTMEVVSVDSATTLTVKNISEQIDDDEELVMQSPIQFQFGFEY